MLLAIAFVVCLALGIVDLRIALAELPILVVIALVIFGLETNRDTCAWDAQWIAELFGRALGYRQR